MIVKRVVLTARARQEVRQAAAWYRSESGAVLALRWAASVETSLKHIGAHPHSGFTRYAVPLKLDALRCWPINGFPYLVFYVEHDDHVDVGRVLHMKRDVPTWLAEP